MKLHNLKDRRKRGYTTWGCMWKQGECGKNQSYVLENQDGTQVPMQSRITAYWPDGSVKWTAHSACADQLTDEIQVLTADGNTQKISHSLIISRETEGILIKTEALSFYVPYRGFFLFEGLTVHGENRVSSASPVLLLEEPFTKNEMTGQLQKQYQGFVEEVTLEEEGPLQAVIKYTGVHISKDGDRKLPFIIRLHVGMDSERLHFTHTFLYDGDENKDFLKGIGLEFTIPVKGSMYNRHVRFEGDFGTVHEALAELLTWRPRVPEAVYSSQMAGKQLILQENDREIVEKVMKDMPFWDEYDFCQDSPSHFRLKKKMKEEGVCYLDCLHGRRAGGAAALGGENGSMGFAIRDFWQTYPSGYTFRSLTGEEAKATVWLYSPAAEAMDFRHYASRGYNQVYYEGYDYKGADPFGIASTSQYSVAFFDEVIPSEEELLEFSNEVNHPPQYVGTSEFYHEHRAFGYWSLPKRESEMEIWLEDQLEKAAVFYEKEVDQRGWYGLFNYGDFMHTYDKERHQWRYDMGGYAWDNTELVPTLWLWLSFLRSGRAETFSLAEKLTRHASEVDVYHMGKYKGLGSRHNVRHWGCPCKEARIAMAAHHRYYYYMTGDHRLEDIFEELKDNEKTFLAKDPLADFYDSSEMVYKSHARSGPDWSSLCANWLTQWERFEDNRYLDKIRTGIEDIKMAPLRLVSGPDFEFDPESVHLRYIGERAAGGTHLQICMGAPQIWQEMADLISDPIWKEMLAEYGRFYYLPREKQLEESGGIIGDREFSLPFMAAAMGAYGAWYYNDEMLAKATWSHLLHALLCEENHSGFLTTVLKNCANQKELREIPWISTNFAAQWCLNVICTLEFIRDQLPKSLEEADTLISGMSFESFRKA